MKSSGISRRGLTTTYTYDSAGRNVQVTLPDESTNLISPADTVEYFSPSSGVGSEFNPAPVVRPEDAISVFTDGRGNKTTYTTGPFGACTSTTDPLLRTTTNTRNLHGNPVAVTEPNGSISTISHDSRGNILTVTQTTGTPVKLKFLAS